MTTSKERLGRFAAELPEWIRLSVELIDYLPVEPSGSRLFCPDHARPDSDWDFLVEADEHWANEMIELGYEASSAGSAGGESGKSLKRTINNQTINLIQIPAGHEHEAFKAATRLCTAIGGPTDKRHRISIFDVIKSQRMTLESLGLSERPEVEDIRAIYDSDPGSVRKVLLGSLLLAHDRDRYPQVNSLISDVVSESGWERVVDEAVPF